jgi:3-oxoacyl-[acyl-carrier-protein] synthase-3
VELLVVTTVVPDQLMPPTSTLVQEALGIEHCTELEISANCSAPTKGLMVASSELRLGHFRRALVCSSQFASFGFVPPWANPARMTSSQSHLRWILSDGAAALALEVAEPDIDLRICLDSRGTGKRPGMSLALGASAPDLEHAFATGAHHGTQDMRYVLKEGMRFVAEGVERMLRTLELPGAGIDHFIPSVSSMRVVNKLRPAAASVGIAPESWRMNFTRVGYVGSVAVPIVLDEMARAGALAPGDVICTVSEESSKWIFAGTVFRWNPWPSAGPTAASA